MLNLLSRILCIFVALQLLNCSVDAPDALSFSSIEDLNYNEQESVIEILIEKVFNFGNVIAEYADGDAENESAGKKLLSVDYFVLPDYSDAEVAVLFFASESYSAKPYFYLNASGDNFSPPPEI